MLHLVVLVAVLSLCGGCTHYYVPATQFSTNNNAQTSSVSEVSSINPEIQPIRPIPKEPGAEHHLCGPLTVQHILKEIVGEVPYNPNDAIDCPTALISLVEERWPGWDSQSQAIAVTVLRKNQGEWAWHGLLFILQSDSVARGVGIPYAGLGYEAATGIRPSKTGPAPSLLVSVASKQSDPEVRIALYKIIGDSKSNAIQTSPDQKHNDVKTCLQRALVWEQDRISSWDLNRPSAGSWYNAKYPSAGPSPALWILAVRQSTKGLRRLKLAKESK